MIPFLEGQEEVYLFYIGLAVGVLLLSTGVMQLLARGENQAEARNRRLKMIGKGATAEEVLALLRPPESSSLLHRLPFLGDLPREMARAGMSMAPSRFLLFCGLGVGALAAGAIGTQFLPPFQAVSLAVILAFFVPVAIVKSMRKKRVEKLVAQLPDSLELMARGLRVGHPLNTSIGAVAREMPDPIGSEFGIIFDQVTYGDDLPSAFQDFAERMDIEDVHYLSVSIAIQHGTGGDLARVVDILAKTIRGRLSMRRRIKAASSEGRLSALILSALPFFLYFCVSISSPTYYSSVHGDPLFLPLLLIALGLIALNAMILHKLTNFRI